MRSKTKHGKKAVHSNMANIFFENEQLKDSPFWQPPFIPISNITYLPETVPWMVYPHFHETEYEVSYIAEGHGILNLPGHLLPIEKGTITLVPPQVAHCYLDEENADSKLGYYTLRFRADGAESQMLSDLKRLGTCTVVDPEIAALCVQLFQMISLRSTDEESRTNPFIQTMGLAILQLTLESLQTNGRIIEPSCPPYANDILKYLQTHIGEKVTMADVAQEFNLSQPHIYRVFRQTYHISPINYLIYCKMRQARSLILKYHMSTEEIARQLAYSNVYHFVHTFQHVFGCTPNQYANKTPDFNVDI